MDSTHTTLQNRLLARARFRHMQVMVAVAELGSVRRAADSIGMTQPAASKVLTDLESLLGLSLFQRHARGVRPTEECLELLVLARQTVHGAASAAAAIAARQRQGEGSVRIMGTPAAINGLLVPVLQGFTRAFPGVHLQLKEATRDDAFLAAARGEIDLILCREPTRAPEGWAFQALMADEFAIFCSPGHPLARRRQVGLAELMQETWLPGPANAATHEPLERLAQESGLPLKLSELATVLSTVNWWMLQQGRLLMLAPASVFRPYQEAGLLSVLRLDRRLPYIPLGLLQSQREPPRTATQRLIQFLQQAHRPAQE